MSFPIARPAARAAGAAARADEADPPQVLAPVELSFAQGGTQVSVSSGAQQGRRECAHR